MVKIVEDKNNMADHIGHRIALSILTVLQVVGSTNVHLISEEEFVDEVSMNLTINIVLVIYTFVILKKSDENRLWILTIIAFLMTSSFLYLESVIETREIHAE